MKMIGFVVALIVAVGLFGVYKLNGGGVPKIGAVEVAQKIKQEITVPKMVNSEIRIDSIEGQGDDVVAKYTLVNFDKFDLPSAAKTMVNNQMHNMFCQTFMADPALSAVMKKSHLEFVIKLYNTTGMILQDIKLKPEDCGG